MLNTLTIIYFIYMFIALYFLSLFTLIFIQNRKEIFYSPKPIKNYSISILIPAYNEEDSLRETVETVLKSNYKNIIEVIIINDGSKDNTLKIADELKKKYSKVIVLNKKNEGNKGAALNYAIPYARGDIIGVVDADSFPDIDAISSMIGFFNEEDVGNVTTNILVRNRDNFLGKMQAIEYKVITFTRKLLGFIDAIYVTPGPLALYRASALRKINGFDKKNVTEDIEATWHLVHEGYKVKMSFISKATTIVPDTFKKWFKQRIRWNIGGNQCILKYKENFFRKGMLGFFILPFFSISLLLGIFGLGIFVYRGITTILTYYLSTKYSIAAQTAIIRLQDVNFNISVLNFLGIVIFLIGMGFTFFALKYVNKRISEKENFFNVIFYSLVYILLNPIITVISMYKFITGRYSW